MRVRLYFRIVSDPEVVSGRPIVEGTQVPASALVAAVASGASLEDVAASFGIAVEDVRAALEYAAQRLGEPTSTGEETPPIAGEDDAPAHTVDEQARALGLDPAQLSPLGRRLLAQRAEVMASTIPLLNWEELDQELAESRRDDPAEPSA